MRYQISRFCLIITMIEYIKGDIDEITPARMVLECNGIGYEIFISLNTYSKLQRDKSAKIYIYEVIREDTHILYGFADKDERVCFVALIGVSGVGPNTARMILSALTPSQLMQVFAEDDVRALTAVKGIGLKTAQRVLVDLKNKLTLEVAESRGSAAVEVGTSRSVVAEEAVAALVMLGFQKQAAQKTVSALLKKQPDMKVEGVIKEALKCL